MPNRLLTFIICSLIQNVSLLIAVHPHHGASPIELSQCLTIVCHIIPNRLLTFIICSLRQNIILFIAVYLHSGPIPIELSQCLTIYCHITWDSSVIRNHIGLINYFCPLILKSSLLITVRQQLVAKPLELSQGLTVICHIAWNSIVTRNYTGLIMFICYVIRNVNLPRILIRSV